MKFRNKRSGIVLEFGEDFKQANWEPIEAPSKPVKSEPKPKKATKKEEGK